MTVLKEISGLACTSCNGADAVRQRNILISSIRKYRSIYLHWVNKESKKMIINLRNICSNHNNNSNIDNNSNNNNDNHKPSYETINIIPLLNKTCLDLMIYMIFGNIDDIEKETFSTSFFSLWEIVRTNTSMWSISMKEKREIELKCAISKVRNHIVHIIRQRRMDSSYDNTSTKCCILNKLLTMTKFEYDPNISANQVSPPRTNTNSGMLQQNDTYSEYSPEHQSNQRGEDIFSFEELIHNLHNLLTASFETTAHVIACTLYFLAHNSSQQDIIAGQDEDKDKEKEAVGRHPHAMKVMRATIKESMRLLPPVLQMARLSAKEVQVGDIRCPVKTSAIIDVVAMHRNKHIWGESRDRFDVSRWLQRDVEENSDHLEAFWKPFGMGPKSCLGQGKLSFMVMNECYYLESLIRIL